MMTETLNLTEQTVLSFQTPICETHHSENLDPLLSYFSKILGELNRVDTSKLTTELAVILRDYSLRFKQEQRSLRALAQSIHAQELPLREWAFTRTVQPENHREHARL